MKMEDFLKIQIVDSMYLLHTIIDILLLLR